MLKLSDPMAQVIILGFICFCCPGMYNALQGTGTYGLDAKDSDVGNSANTALSVVFAFSSLFAGALFNILGHRLLLILGGLSYALYIGSFLAYNSIHSIVFVVLASCLLGVGAGWLWCAQGAVMIGYPEESEKGKYFSIFWAIFNLGGVLGNVIPLGIQWNDEKAGGATDASYIGYMVVMTFGALMSVLLLPASKVFRKDGTPVVKIKYSSPISELKSVFALFKDWRMLSLVPLFFASNWVYTYQFTAAARFAGFYKFVQNLGGILAPVVQTSRIGNGPKNGDNALNAVSAGMGEFIICIVLVFLGVICAIPVAYKAVQNHTIEDDDVVTGKQDAVISEKKDASLEVHA
ncbi:hypothetical protein BGZ68_007087 [Mortierella alpina]|nr:hypothetical protein BGZ68_007087 [Mortierella alpina]